MWNLIAKWIPDHAAHTRVVFKQLIESVVSTDELDAAAKKVKAGGVLTLRGVDFVPPATAETEAVEEAKEEANEEAEEEGEEEERFTDNCVAPEEETLIDKHDVPEPVADNLNVVDPAGEGWGGRSA